MNKKIILSHPTGNANVRALANGLANAGILKYFYTTIASYPNNIWFKLSRIKPFGEFSRRSFDISIEHYTHQYPWYDLGRQVASKLGLHGLLKHETGVFCIDKVYHRLDSFVAKKLRKLSRNKSVAIYAYEDGALASFERAKLLGIATLYDLPIGYWRSARTLLKAEQIRRPEWAETLTGFRDSEEKLKRKDMELALADYIFVASSFTAFTLKQYVGSLAPIKIIPYGFPPVNESKTYSYDGKRVLKLLFVGGLSQRKGIANLFEAVEGLENRVSLTVVGHKVVAKCSALNNALLQHTWIPSVPHNKVLQLMREHDVLVFPSLFEGFGLVITEAMSQGTPVITTNRTAGPDIINSDVDGWIVEAGSTTALKSKIEYLLNNPSAIEKAGRAAIETAKKRPWEVYEKEMAQCIKEITQTV